MKFKRGDNVITPFGKTVVVTDVKVEALVLVEADNFTWRENELTPLKTCDHIIVPVSTYGGGLTSKNHWPHCPKCGEEV